MFTLLSGLWKYVFQKDEYFVLILGLDNAGKTVTVFFFIFEFYVCNACTGVASIKLGDPRPLF